MTTARWCLSSNGAVQLSRPHHRKYGSRIPDTLGQHRRPGKKPGSVFPGEARSGRGRLGGYWGHGAAVGTSADARAHACGLAVKKCIQTKTN